MSSPDRNASISDLSLKNILPAKLAILALRSMATKAKIVLGWNALAAVIPTTRISELAETFDAASFGPTTPEHSLALPDRFETPASAAAR